MQTDETRARAETVLRKFGDGLSWQRGRGNDTWDAAIRAMIAFAAPPAVDELESARDYVDRQDCKIQDMDGDLAGYSGQQMVESFMAGAALSLHPSDREAIARVVKGARLSAAFGREFRAGDGRLDDVDLDAADAILALSGSPETGNAPE